MPSRSFNMRRGRGVILTLLAVVCLSPSALAQQAAGVVIDIEGRWVQGGTRELSRGQTLPAGGSISAVSPTRYDYIVIANLNGDVILSRHCRNLGECDAPLRLPSPPREPRSFLRVIVQSGMRLLLGNPDEFSRHGSRGAVFLPNAVVRLKAGRVDLAPLFRDREKGAYHVRLRLAGKGRESKEGGWLGPLPVEWVPGGTAGVSTRRLRPGLYEVDLTDAAGTHSETGGNYAWVLIVRGRAHAESLISFGRAEALTRKWGDQVSPEAADSFLRAYLSHLAARTRR